MVRDVEAGNRFVSCDGRCFGAKGSSFSYWRHALVVLTLAIVGLMNLFVAPNDTYADTLSLSVDTNLLTMDLTPSLGGRFSSSSNATISVTTENCSGYHLSIVSSTGSTDLTNGVNNDRFTSISNAIDERSFSDDAGYNNMWGYRPSQYISVNNGVSTINQNTDYRPLPGADGEVIATTNSANAIVDNYTLSIGARANTDIIAGTYNSDAFVIVAVPNVAMLTVDYMANNDYTEDLYYGSDVNETVNPVHYDAISQQVPITNPQYSHTANINDDGTNNGNYSNNLNTNEVISFPGADHLGLTLTYQTESCCDFVVVWPGSFPSYRAGTSSDVNKGTKYANSTRTTTNTTINDSAVTFGFKSDSSSNNYGYYAVVTGYDANNNVLTHVTGYSKSVISGDYATPTLPAGMNLVGWSESSNAIEATYVDESDVSSNMPYTNIDPAVTLYPVYTADVTIKTVTGVSSVYIRELGTSKNVCTTSSTSGNTCALTVGKSYTLTMSARTGYSFSSWVNSGEGVIDSVSSSSTTFTVGAGPTTITADVTPNAYNITVNVIGGISNIEFANDTYGTQNVPATGGTIQLRYDQRYDITVTLANGNHFVSWGKTSGSGIFGSTNTMNTYFTPGSGIATIQIRAANTQIKTVAGVDSVTVSKDGDTICATTDATTGAYCNLILGVQYDINAVLHQGYSFDSWNNTGNGTIGDNTALSTTFIPIQSSAIDVLTPSAVGNPYTVTVVFGNEHVTSVTIDGETFTNSGSTKTLIAGTTYNISGTTDLNTVDFVVSSNGNLSGGRLIVYGDTTLVAEGSDKIYMQNVSSATLASLMPNVGDEMVLYDNRDNNSYTVAHMADGKYWMTQNLDLCIGCAGVDELTSDNTNLVTTNGDGYSRVDGVITWTPPSTAITSNYTVTDENKVSPAWATGYDNRTPYSAEGGDRYVYTSGTTSEDTVFNSLADCMVVGGHTEAECRHYHVGNYYNWTAAIASYSNRYANGNDICPTGWRIPRGPNSSATTAARLEFGELFRASGIIDSLASTASYSSGGFNNIRISPIYLVRGGWLMGSNLYDLARKGEYLIENTYSNGVGKTTFTSSEIRPSTSSTNFDIGSSVRCVAK